MKTPEEIRDIINQATGTTAYHIFSPIKGYPVITDGVRAVAEAAECFWLLDIIGSYQGDKRLDKDFQVWALTKNEDNSAKVQGYNDTTLIITQEIEWTDFPLHDIELWVENGVILLPSEH